MHNATPQISENLTGRTVYIIGPSLLNNEAIAGLISLRTNANCLCVKTFGDINSAAEENKHPVLFLLDCMGKSLGNFMDDLISYVRKHTETDHIAFFNVRSGMRIEESCMNEGVRGIFYEDVNANIFLKGICAISRGELWFSRESMTKYILDERDETITTLKARKILTAREIEILSLLAIGCKNDDIAGKLCISSHTIKTHLYNIYKKINVSNRLQATLWAAKNL